MNQSYYGKEKRKPNQQSQKEKQSSLLNDLDKFFKDGNHKTGNLFDRLFTKLSEVDLLISEPDSKIILSITNTCCKRKKDLPIQIWLKLEREIINNINNTKNPKFFNSKNRIKSLRQNFLNSDKILNCIDTFNQTTEASSYSYK